MLLLQLRFNNWTSHYIYNGCRKLEQRVWKLMYSFHLPSTLFNTSRQVNIRWHEREWGPEYIVMMTHVYRDSTHVMYRMLYPHIHSMSNQCMSIMLKRYKHLIGLNNLLRSEKGVTRLQIKFSNIAVPIFHFVETDI